MAESTLLSLLLVFIINSAISDGSIETNVISTQNNEDFCTSECMRKVSVDMNNIATSESCSRGCRFFTLSQLIEKKKFEGKITEACQAMCEESYGDKGSESTSCRTGCESSSVQRIQVPVVAELSWSWFIDSGSPMQILQGDIGEPDDVLTDPSLRSQITRMETLRIPEIRLRTMPVLQDKSIQVEGAPALCTGATVRGVQSCLVWSLLLLLTLVGLWSCVGEVRDHSSTSSLSSGPPPLLHPVK
ncbi:hypothetical protein O3M35_002192 [Rhynocoris fuscipes]|uniref:Transmembrane protein 59 n=1 Tax=Rhynocoris fuscipes TaxID=488301 RepID=A0AAW1CW52_9HEMI